MNKDKDDFNVLFLPWHLKADYSWLKNRDKRLTSPAQAFFSKPVIHGENIELGTIYTQSQDPIQHYIKFLFQNRRKIENFGELMIPINVKYIILAKDSDYKSYDFLYHQEDLELVRETAHLVLFKNKHRVARIYEVDDIAYINDWKKLLKVSEEEDISQKLYIVGGKTETVPVDSEYKAISYTQENPAHLILDRQPKRDYLVLTESYSKQWDYGDNTRLEAFGATNAFVTDDAEISELKYRRFYSAYLPAYCISITSFALIIIVALYRLLIEYGNRLNKSSSN